MLDVTESILSQDSTDTNSLTLSQARRRAWLNEESRLKSQLARSPRNPRTLLELGRHYSKMDKIQAARECLHLVAEIKPGYRNVEMEILIIDMTKLLRETTRTVVAKTMGTMSVKCTVDWTDPMTRLMIRYLARAQRAYVPGSTHYRDVYGDVVGNIAAHRLEYQVSVGLSSQLLKYTTPDCELRAHLSAQNIPNVLRLKRSAEKTLSDDLPEEFSTENPFWDGAHCQPYDDVADCVVYDPEREATLFAEENT